MELSSLLGQVGLSVALGLLVGLQRERVESRVAGLRTFALATLLGTLAAQLATALGGWVVVAGLLAVTGLLVVANLISRNAGSPDPGQTTEVALLLMYLTGAYLVLGNRTVAVVVAGGTAVLLHLKPQLGRLVRRMGEADFRAIMQFALLSLVILPILPDRAFGAFEVLNPREIWWMVVLIVGISLAGYVGYKLLSDRAGALLAGLFGGLVASTATTVAAARRSVSHPVAFTPSLLVISVATAVGIVRLLIEVAVVAPAFLADAGPPLGLLLTVFLAAAGLLWFRCPSSEERLGEQANPSELKTALVFGLLYAVVLFAVAAAEERFGSSGLYLVAALSGLTDTDAITLSTSRLVADGRVEGALGGRLLLVGVMANLVFKAGAVAVLAHRRLAWRSLLLFALALAVGVLYLLVA